MVTRCSWAPHGAVNRQFDGVKFFLDGAEVDRKVLVGDLVNGTFRAKVPVSLELESAVPVCRAAHRTPSTTRLSLHARVWHTVNGSSRSHCSQAAVDTTWLRRRCPVGKSDSGKSAMQISGSARFLRGSGGGGDVYGRVNRAVEEALGENVSFDLRAKAEPAAIGHLADRPSEVRLGVLLGHGPAKQNYSPFGDRSSGAIRDIMGKVTLTDAKCARESHAREIEKTEPPIARTVLNTRVHDAGRNRIESSQP
jgi:hypothetical protein